MRVRDMIKTVGVTKVIESEAPEPKTDERAERKAARKAHKAEVAAWRTAHPAERDVNRATVMHMWPRFELGRSKADGQPIAGAHAELFNAGAHRGWTATRVLAGAATFGVSAAATGRKNKGYAAINITWADGSATVHTVKPDGLRDANAYVAAFNAYSAELS